MSSSSSKPLDGLRILVAEDEPFLILDLHDLLTTAGAQVIGPASSVRKAMALAEAEAIDCAVLDVHFHDGNIDPVADVLHRKGVGLVFVTGSDGRKLSENWPSALTVPKPANVLALIEACQKARAQTI